MYIALNNTERGLLCQKTAKNQFVLGSLSTRQSRCRM